jgi:Asp-tRNA(Asn)/Glu-tRNA(Gln) amidotransferase A subunit family amidase
MQINSVFGCIHSTTGLSLKKVNSHSSAPSFRWNQSAPNVGLPVGVQVAARHWHEDIVLAVMAAIEEHFQSQPDYPAHPPV